MTKNRTLILITTLLCCILVQAQRRLTVVDVETLFPINRVNVVANGLTTQTDSLGHVVVTDSCRSVVFSHVNYESRLINLEEVRDTVFLISKLLNLKEVVVFGKAKNNDDEKKLNERLGLRLSEEEIQAINASQNSGVNVLGLVNMLIPKKWKEKWKKNTKEGRRERLKQILRDY